jgi:hypothetical protein
MGLGSIRMPRSACILESRRVHDLASGPRELDGGRTWGPAEVGDADSTWRPRRAQSSEPGIETMSRWLYSSTGIPIAFEADGLVYARSGKFLGRLDGTEVWHDRYVGEIVHGEIFVRKTFRPILVREAETSRDPPDPGALPPPREPVVLTSEFQDLEPEVWKE